MKKTDTLEKVAKKVRSVFNDGFPMEPDSIAFIESTYGISEREILKGRLFSGITPEDDPDVLLDLIPIHIQDATFVGCVESSSMYFIYVSGASSLPPWYHLECKMELLSTRMKKSSSGLNRFFKTWEMRFRMRNLLLKH